MNRLEQIKDEYAEKYHAHDWESFVRNQVSWWVEAQMDDICKIYAEECVKASLDKASEKAELDGCMDSVFVNKESITNPVNIVLL